MVYQFDKRVYEFIKKSRGYKIARVYTDNKRFFRWSSLPFRYDMNDLLDSLKPCVPKTACKLHSTILWHGEKYDRIVSVRGSVYGYQIQALQEYIQTWIDSYEESVCCDVLPLLYRCVLIWMLYDLMTFMIKRLIEICIYRKYTWSDLIMIQIRVVLVCKSSFDSGGRILMSLLWNRRKILLMRYYPSIVIDPRRFIGVVLLDLQSDFI
jgi:hypothetical protein